MPSNLERLLAMLRETMTVEEIGGRRFAIGSLDGDIPPAVMIVNEPDLERHLQRLAPSAIEAMEYVGDDPTGITAALSLLSIHLDEELFVDSAIGPLEQIRIAPEGLVVTR